MSMSGHSGVSRREGMVVHCPARVSRAQILRAYEVALLMYYKTLSLCTTKIIQYTFF